MLVAPRRRPDGLWRNRLLHWHRCLPLFRRRTVVEIPPGHRGGRRFHPHARHRSHGFWLLRLLHHERLRIRADSPGPSGGLLRGHRLADPALLGRHHAHREIRTGPSAATGLLFRSFVLGKFDAGHPSAGTVRSGALSEEQWKDSVRSGVAAIAHGGLEKVVLARDVLATLEEPVRRVSILQRLVGLYDECWTYGVRGLVGATPEILIKVDGSTAQARVLAGTLDREDEPAGSTGFADSVLGGSIKQRQEHDFAVRSLIRQLAPFATDMSFPAEPFILELPNVWHLASDVSAQLASSNGHVPTSLALVEALHPTAAVCGTPREEAATLILQLEQMDRGPYAGPVGWLDGAGNGEWGIALRGAVLEDSHSVRLYAGAGIVEASDPEAELAETWAKLRPMLQALNLPNHP